MGRGKRGTKSCLGGAKRVKKKGTERNNGVGGDGKPSRGAREGKKLKSGKNRG